MVDIKYFGDYKYYKILYSQLYVEFVLFHPYEKTHFSNRCFIPGANGPILLSIPLQGGRNQRTILKEVRIDNSEDWQKRHWRSLLATYNASPWFKYYRDSLSDIFGKRFSFLVDWNLECLAWSVEKLKLPIHFKVISSSEEGWQRIPDPGKMLAEKTIETPRYQQLFQDKTGFVPGVSILDMLFCEGQSRVLAFLEEE